MTGQEDSALRGANVGDREPQPPRSLLAGGLLTAALSGGGVAFVVAPRGLMSAVVLAAAGAFAILVVLTPTEFLPAVALAIYVVIPQQAVGYLAGASPAAVVLAVWAVRRVVGEGTGGASSWTWLARFGAATVLGWGLYLLLTSEVAVDTSPSSRWLVTFALGLFAPLLVSTTDDEARVLWRVWPAITAAAACYVVLEYVLHANPLYDTVYAIAGRSVPQEWAIYRSHGSFGHPLYSATFFAVSAAAAFGRWMSVGKGAWWIVAGFVGLLVTVSRGPLAALAVAVGVIVVLAFARRRSVRPRRLGRVAVIVGVGVALVLGSGLLGARSNSVEAQSSAAVRSGVWERATAAAAFTDWQGSGAATSHRLIEAWRGPVLENSWLQVLISLGVVGLAAFALIILAILANSVARVNLASAGAVVALTVSLYGYEGIEGVPPVLTVFGLLAITAAASRAVNLTVAHAPKHDLEWRGLPRTAPTASRDF